MGARDANGTSSDLLGDFRQAVHGLDHAEGVAWAPDGTLYAGGEAGQLYRALTDGSLEQVADTEGFVLGVALDSAGAIYACDYARREVVWADPATGLVATYSRGTAAQPFRLPNACAFDDAGVLYVTDSGDLFATNGTVVRVEPGGHATMWATSVAAFPNGCCLNADGDTLFVIQTDDPGLDAIPINPDGSAAAPRRIAALPETVPDGLAAAADGSVYVTTYRPDAIYRIDPGGQVEVVAHDRLGWILSGPTSIAFGGPDLRQVVVANLAGNHLTLGRVDTPGLRLRYPVIP